MIKVHHLKIGRSVFTVWLLEEMGLDYELKIYERNPDTFRSQDDLKAVHPLAKSPVIEDGPLMLAESGAITAYLLETYDTQHKLAPAPGAPGRAEFLYWLHFAEGSLALPMIFSMTTRRAENVPAQVSGFVDGEVRRYLGYLDGVLKDRAFITGDTFSAADTGLGFCLWLALALKHLQDYPNVEAYLKRITSRPAFLKAIEKTGG